MTPSHLSPSRIGFGCASLGSRIGAKSGIAALNRAFDLGVNWFDLAPSYGDGLAEDIFSRFSQQRRAEIYVCTKCGIGPARSGLLASAVKPAARTLVRYAPGLREIILRRRPAPKRVPLSADFVAASLKQSLRRLRTDYVDVLALHDPDVDELESDEVRRALEGLLASGRVRGVGIAGSLEAARTALELGLPITHIQIAHNPLQPQLPLLQAAINAAGKNIHTIIHSALTPSVYRRLAQVFQSESALQSVLLRTYDLAFDDSLHAALVDYALHSSNPSGTVLLSMFSGKHVEFNMRRLNATARPDALSFFEMLRLRAGHSVAAG